MKLLKEYKFKNLTLVFLNILLAVFLAGTGLINDILLPLGNIALVGPLIAGILFVSAFTAATGAVMLIDLAKTISPIEVAIIGGLGGAVGDLFIFRFFKHNLLEELTIIYNRLGGKHLTKIIYHKHMRRYLPVLGAIIIASPLPDEIGIGLMGISNVKTYKFIILSVILDIAGVFAFVSVFSLLQ